MVYGLGPEGKSRTAEGENNVHITVNLPWEKDLSVNRYRFGRAAPGQQRRNRRPHVQAWHDRAVWEIRLAWQVANADETGRGIVWSMIPKPEPPIYIAIDYRWPDRRRRDPGNYHKVIEDSIKVAIGVDDRHFRVSDGDVTINKDNPGFSVEIRDEL